MMFRIRSIDLDGFNGREDHPEAADLGLTVTPIGMRAIYCDADGAEEAVLGEDGRLSAEALVFLQAAAEGTPADVAWGEILRVWTCVTQDGRILELMDEEIEILAVGAMGGVR